MRSHRPLIATLTLLVILIACRLPGTPTTPDEGELETIVAATLSAAPPGPKPGGQTQITAKPAQTESSIPTTATPTLPPPPPSVLRIVYTDAGNVWLIEGTNAPVQLTSSGNTSRVLISSDGLKVAYIRRVGTDQQPEIHAINTDGTGETILLTPAQIDALYPLDPAFTHNDIANIAFVPGTHHLMFNTRAVATGPGLFKYNDLVLLDTDSGSLSSIFSPGDGGDFTVAPNGNQIALVRPENISLADVDGSNLHSNLITYTPVITYSEFQYYAQPVWMSNSNAFGIAIPSSDPMAPGTNGAVWRIPADGSAALILSTISGDFYFAQAFSKPVLSPDLQRVAFLRDTVTLNVKDLYLADANGSGQIVYATGEIQWKGWAPDSLHFVYSFGGPMNLQLGEDGGGASSIGSCTNLRWVDSMKYLCLSGSLGSWTIMVGHVGGGLSAIVSPAGDFIAYDFDA